MEFVDLVRLVGWGTVCVVSGGYLVIRRFREGRSCRRFLRENPDPTLVRYWVCQHTIDKDRS